MAAPEYNQRRLSLIERASAINPEIGRSFVLKTYSWPAAVLHRVGYYVEIGAAIDDALAYAMRQLTKPTFDPKRVMIDFINEQNAKCAQHSVTNQFHEHVLESSGIHIVDLADPFVWNGTKALQNHSLISDLAGLAINSGGRADQYFGMVMGAEKDHFGRCIIDLNEAIKSYTAARK